MKKAFIIALAGTLTFIPVFAAFVAAEFLYTHFSGYNLGGASIILGGLVSFILALCVIITSDDM